MCSLLLRTVSSYAHVVLGEGILKGEFPAVVMWNSDLSSPDPVSDHLLHVLEVGTSQQDV